MLNFDTLPPWAVAPDEGFEPVTWSDIDVVWKHFEGRYIYQFQNGASYELLRPVIPSPALESKPEPEASQNVIQEAISAPPAHGVIENTTIIRQSPVMASILGFISGIVGSAIWVEAVLHFRR